MMPALESQRVDADCTPTTTDPSAKRLTTIVLSLVIALVVVLVWARWNREHALSSSIKQRLVGTWTHPSVREGGESETWIWEFRADGTIRNHPQGKPFPETGNVDDYIQWDVVDGQLVLSWDYHFTRQASVKQRLRQVTRLVTNTVKNKDMPLSYSNRCLIHDTGGDTIAFTLHPDEAESGSYVPREFSLTRAPGTR